MGSGAPEAIEARDPSAEHAPPRPWVAVTVGVAVATVGFAADQVTKRLAEEMLVPGRLVEVLGGWFGWELIFNRGGAFGLPAPSWVFLAVTVLVVVIVARSLPRTRSLSQASAFGLLLAGALGNAADRVTVAGGLFEAPFFGGRVVDFIALELPVIGSWPRFNLADVSIFCAFVLLVASLLAGERAPHDPRPPGPGSSVDAGSP